MVKDPNKAMDACEDFFTIVVEAHIVSAVMVLFGMNTTDDKPTASFIPTDYFKLENKEQAHIMKTAAKKIVDTFVDISYADKEKIHTI